MDNQIVFEIFTPLGFLVRTTRRYWDVITIIKHPIMHDQIELVKLTLYEPDEIRESRSDRSVYLFYKFVDKTRWICAVTKRLNGDGFLITTYPTDKIKEGKRIWHR